MSGLQRIAGAIQCGQTGYSEQMIKPNLTEEAAVHLHAQT